MQEYIFLLSIINIFIDCPTHCATCTNDTNCLTCTPGYGLLNNLCVLCPDGTYLSTLGVCKSINLLN